MLVNDNMPMPSNAGLQLILDKVNESEIFVNLAQSKNSKINLVMCLLNFKLEEIFKIVW